MHTARPTQRYTRQQPVSSRDSPNGCAPAPVTRCASPVRLAPVPPVLVMPLCPMLELQSAPLRPSGSCCLINMSCYQ